MDNDIKVIKYIKETIKKTKFKLDYKDINIMDESTGNEYIKKLILGSNPCAVVRGGATEMRCISEYLAKNGFSNKIKEEIHNLSGVFPADNQTLDRFCRHYIECISQADLISLWGVGAESKVIHKYCKDSRFTKLHALEPYYFSNPWSRVLEDKKVLIIHPFIETVMHQYEHRDEIWPTTHIIPKFKDLICIKAVQSIAGQKTEFESWFKALQSMEEQIHAADFDVAIIGAGAYGLPLALYCKKEGKKAIQMSGATQILFGIKGKRWDMHPVISSYYNEAWVRPNLLETPKDNEKVEGGSYW